MFYEGLVIVVLVILVRIYLKYVLLFVYV